MVRVLLDTNTCIEIVRGRRQSITARIQQVGLDATHNTNELNRVPNLRIEDWEQS